MSNFVSLLGKVHEDIQSALIVFKSGTDLSADDEFEMEMVLSTLEKNSAKVREISAKYKKPDVPAEQPSTSLGSDEFERPIDDGIDSNKGDTNVSNSSACVKPVDENSNSVEDLEQMMIGSEPENYDAEFDEAVEFPDIAETDHADSRKGDSLEEHADDAMAFMDDDFDDADLQMINEAENSFLNEAIDDVDVVDLTLNEEANHFEEEDLDPTEQPNDPKYSKALKEHFGYNKFRPLQWKIINSVLNEKKDNCVVMATGRGKSLCYQFPSVITGRLSVVVSPLISLMEDQVIALNAVNVSACFLGSAQQQTSKVKQDLQRGFYRVVYMTPEFVTSADSFLRDLHQSVGIDLVAIDEAHCVSQWGHDFRAAYRDLGKLRTTLPQVPIMALTATATPQVCKDICSSLKLKKPVITCSSFDRPNLYLSVSMKTGNTMQDLKAKLSSVTEGAIIIYCPTRKATEEVNNIVKAMGYSCELYHAGLSLPMRKSVHKQFLDDEIQVVVATVAFGMGIDKPDVRLVIHYGAPKDIESYYQEIGRGGRDGQKSTCHAYYSSSDFNTNRYFLKDIKCTNFFGHKKLMLKKMEEYLAGVSCRRRAILSHFENKSVDDVGGTSWCCDNCTEKIASRQAELLGLPSRKISDAKTNLGREAMDLLRAVQVTGERFGLGVPILFLRGSASQKLPSHCQSHGSFGKGKYRSEKWWKVLSRQIMNEGFLKEVPIQSGFGSTVELTVKGKNWIQSQGSNPELMIMPNKELQQMEHPAAVKPALVPFASSVYTPRILPIVPQNTWTSTKSAQGKSQNTTPLVDPVEMKNQRDLYAKMITTRNDLSHETGLPSFALFSNKSLLDLAKYRPTTIENMLKLEEIAVARAQKYGSKLLDLIKEFCEQRNWKTDHFEQDVLVSHKMTSREQAALNNLSETIGLSYQLFEGEKKSLETVAHNRGLKTTTIVAHLSEALKQGLTVDLDRLGVTDAIVQRITNAIRKPPINSDISRLTPIKEQLPDFIEFNHIKIVIAMLQYRFGMTDTKIDDIPGDSNGSLSVKSPLVKSQSAPPLLSPSSQGTKRKLPPWMAASSANKKSTKVKKNPLFGR